MNILLESLRKLNEEKEETETKDWRIELDGEPLLDFELEKEEKFATKEDAIDWIGFLDYEHEWENWDPETEVKIVNIKTGESEVIDIEELHKKLTNESLKELKKHELNEEKNDEDKLFEYAQTKKCVDFSDLLEYCSLEEIKYIIDNTYKCLFGGGYFNEDETTYILKDNYIEVYVNDKFDGKYYISYDRSVDAYRLYTYDKDIEEDIENNNKLNPKIFYKCSVDNEYFVSIYPEKIKEKNPKDKNIWILEWKENGNIEDCENGKQYYLNNVIGDKEALDEYINRKQQEKITILESLKESIIDGEDDDIINLYKEDGMYWGMGEIISTKAKTLKDLIDDIEAEAQDYDMEMYTDVEVNTDDVDWEEKNPEDLGSVTVTWIPWTPDEGDEEFDEEATKILKERFLNKQVEVIVDYGGTGPDKWDTEDWVVIENIEVYSSDSQITVDLYRDFSQQINGRDYSFRYSGWITLDFKDFGITENMSREEKLNQLKTIPFDNVENVISKAAANNGCKIEAY